MRTTHKIIPFPAPRCRSQYFKCPSCGYSEPRLIQGDVSTTPCPKCGHVPMYRV